jgi:hypothetical protein
MDRSRRWRSNSLAMYSISLSDIDPIWFVPFPFVVAWFVIVALMSIASGWHRLSRIYPARSWLPTETFRSATMALGSRYFPVSYKNCLTVQIGAEGIGFSVWLPFRILHPPLFIPWSSIAECKEEKSWFITARVLYITDSKTRFIFRGKIADAIGDNWQRCHFSK